MFGRVTILQGSPDQFDEAARYVEEKAIPQARQLDGFKGYVNLADRSTGKGMTVTFWDTEEAMLASIEAANQIRSTAAAALESEILSVEQFEVTSWDL